MANSVVLKFACLVIACMVVGAPIAESAITCAQVTSGISACIPVVQSGAGAVPPACCNGVKSLSSMAATPADRQQVCNCLKSLAAGMPGINYNNVNSLPGKCGANIPYKLSPTTDCTRYLYTYVIRSYKQVWITIRVMKYSQPI